MPEFPTLDEADALVKATVAALKSRPPAALAPADLALLLAVAQRDRDSEARRLALTALESASVPADEQGRADLARNLLTAAHLSDSPGWRERVRTLLPTLERSVRHAPPEAVATAATALLHASWVLEEPQWQDAGLRLLGEALPEASHAWAWGAALLDAYEVSGRTSWLDAARTLADGGLSAPAGAPMHHCARAAEWLARLGRATGDTPLQEQARALLQAMKDEAEAQPGSAGGAAFALACLRVAEEPVHIVIPGAPDDPRTQALLRAALRVDHWHRLAQAADPVQDAGLLDALGYYGGSQPMAYVCYNLTCSQPLTEPEQIAEAVRRLVNAGKVFPALGGAPLIPGPAPFLNLGGGPPRGPVLGLGTALGGTAGADARDDA